MGYSTFLISLNNSRYVKPFSISSTFFNFFVILCSIHPLISQICESIPWNTRIQICLCVNAVWKPRTEPSFCLWSKHVQCISLYQFVQLVLPYLSAHYSPSETIFFVSKMTSTFAWKNYVWLPKTQFGQFQIGTTFKMFKQRIFSFQ